MTIDFEDPDETNPELRKALNESFQDYLPKEFRTEYEGNESIPEKKTKPRIKKWDKLIRRWEIKQLNNLDINERSKCPYLQKIENSDFFYYCSLIADDFHIKGEFQYSSMPRRKSAEFKSRADISELEQHCLGSNYKHCEVHERHMKEIDELEKELYD